MNWKANLQIIGTQAGDKIATDLRDVFNEAISKIKALGHEVKASVAQFSAADDLSGEPDGAALAQDAIKEATKDAPAPGVPLPAEDSPGASQAIPCDGCKGTGYANPGLQLICTTCSGTGVAPKIS